MDNATMSRMVKELHGAADPVKAAEAELERYSRSNALQAQRIVDLETQVARATQDRGDAEAKCSALAQALERETTSRRNDKATWSETLANAEKRLVEVRAAHVTIAKLEDSLRAVSWKRAQLEMEVESVRLFLTSSFPVRVAHVTMATALKLREVFR